MESLAGERLVFNGLIDELCRVEVTGDGRGVNMGGLYRRMAVDLNFQREESRRCVWAFLGRTFVGTTQ